MRITWYLEAPVLRRPKLFAKWIRRALHSLVMVNYEDLLRKPLPPLYRSGVVFEEEPRGTETFRDARNVWKRGYGDCAHLAAWRCAELRAAGEDAKLRVKWSCPRHRRRRLFHVQVRRADGRIEDPARRLGM